MKCRSNIDLTGASRGEWASSGTVVASHSLLLGPPVRRTSPAPDLLLFLPSRTFEGALLFWVFLPSFRTVHIHSTTLFSQRLVHADAQYGRTHWRFASATITGAWRATRLSVWMLIKVPDLASNSFLMPDSPASFPVARATLEAASGSLSISHSTPQRQRSA